MSLDRLSHCLVIIAVCIASPSLWAVASTSSTEQQTLSRLPQVFEHNAGQFDANFDYIAQTPETFFAFAKDRVNLVLKNKTEDHKANLLSMTFLGANKAPSISGLNPMPQRVNYLRGKPSQWLYNVQTFSKIEYSELYPGIDLQFHFNDILMEFDFIVAPGVNPNQIAFNIEHAEQVQLNEKGELEILLNGERLIQKAPVLYQTISGKRHGVQGSFIQDGNTIRFQVGDYNPKFSLVIDPVIEFSSYWGGQWEDQGNVIKVDSQGNIILAGATSALARITVENILTSEAVALPVVVNTETSTLFQKDHGISLNDSIVAGANLNLDEEVYRCDYRYQGLFNNDRMVEDYDGFISKFDSNFQPIFTTYFGGCSNDSLRAMVIDSEDNIYVTGSTSSADFPIKSAAQSTISISRFKDDPNAGLGDAIYAKFDKDGELLFSSFLGGDGQDSGRDIAIDDKQNIYLLGYTRSMNLKTTPCPVFGARAMFCDYIGGINLAAAKSGSQDIVLYADVFIAKISVNGDVIRYLSYFGGKFDDWGQSILWRDGEIYIGGTTSSPDLPLPDNESRYRYMPYNANQTESGEEILCTRSRVQAGVDVPVPDAHICRDAFLAKLSLDENNEDTLEFVSYLGGDDDDSLSQLALDSQGNIYLVGTTKSKGGRLVLGGAYQRRVSEDVSVDDFFSRKEAEALMAEFLEPRFPLFKNINQYEYELDPDENSAFLTVFNPEADKLIVSSLIGGKGGDAGSGISLKENAVNGNDEPFVDIYLSGHTLSENFYTKKSFQSKPIQSDMFLVKLTLDLNKSDADYDSINPDNPVLCSRNSCDLYEIKYSTLIGGEDLDSVKSMALLPNDAGLVMSGVTFSKKFPLTDNSLKSTIRGIPLRTYEPFTRKVIDEFLYYPSDMSLIKLTDVEAATDLSLSIVLDTTGQIKEDSTVNYSILLENRSDTQLASSVRLVINYPYVSRLEEINRNIRLIDENNCIVETRQMYCLIGDMAPEEKKVLRLEVTVKNSGKFSLSGSVSSMTANAGSDAFQTKSITVQERSSGSLNLWLLLSLIIVLLIRHCVATNDHRIGPQIGFKR